MTNVDLSSSKVEGTGVPLVLVPGIQGRWEYMRPAIDALARRFRVITFPLCGERASRRRFEHAMGFDNFVDQLDAVLDDNGLERAVVCGVSFGGLIALRYAAERPGRVTALVLSSTPGPTLHLSRRHQFYARAPLIFGPAFLAEIPVRTREEIARTFPVRRDQLRFSWRQLRTFLRAPLSVSRMAERARLLGAPELLADCSRVSAPTLVVTGEPALDHVVPVGGTSEYVRLIAGARAVRIEHSGHLGYITRPEVFATILGEFVASLGIAHANLEHEAAIARRVERGGSGAGGPDKVRPTVGEEHDAA